MCSTPFPGARRHAQDIQPAKALDGRRDQAFDGGGIANVGQDRERLPPAAISAATAATAWRSRRPLITTPALAAASASAIGTADVAAPARNQGAASL